MPWWWLFSSSRPAATVVWSTRIWGAQSAACIFYTPPELLPRSLCRLDFSVLQAPWRSWAANAPGAFPWLSVSILMPIVPGL